MSRRHLSVTEHQLLLQEAHNFTDGKTQQALETHEQQLEACGEKLAAREAFSRQTRQIQQHSDPIQLLEVVLYGVFLPVILTVPAKLL